VKQRGIKQKPERSLIDRTRMTRIWRMSADKDQAGGLSYQSESSNPRKSAASASSAFYQLRIEDISVVSPKNDLIRVLRESDRKYPGTISKNWFTRSVIGNIFIEAAYIYHLK
jgi:hypothetical protein